MYMYMYIYIYIYIFKKKENPRFSAQTQQSISNVGFGRQPLM